MLLVVRLFLLRWLAARTLGGVVAGMLGAALPLAVLLKIVGLPLLAVVAVVGAPVGAVLGLLRLPIRIVLGVVSVVSGLVATAFAVGVFAVKVVLLTMIVWLVVRLARGWARRRRPEQPVVMGPIV